MNKKNFALFCALMLLTSAVFAGTEGEEFQTTYELLVGWMEGYLGRIIAITLLIVGLAMGAVKQSVIAAVPAIAAALILSVGPTIIGAIVGATI